MPRVLLVCEYGSLNGGERSLLAVADDVRSAGFELHLATPPGSDLAGAATARAIPLVPVPLQDSAGHGESLSARRAAVRRMIERVGPDLLHANSVAMSRLCGPVAADAGVPSLGHLRDIIGLSRAAVADLNRNRRLLAVSQATRDWYVAAGLSGDRVRVLYNGVDLARFRPGPATGYLHRELGLSPDLLLVGTIGQIGIRKGLHGLAQAARCVVDRVPAVHFVVVGRRYSDKAEARDYEADLLRMTACEPLAGRFHFLGLRDDVDRLLNELTILAHAARQEPLGRVLLEAAAAGTPVVATDVGGTREVFPAEAGAAVLVSADDPKALADALVAALCDPRRRQSLGNAARRRAEAAFDARRAAAGLVNHYRELLWM
jgi:glycosyltransferase involved in cell wall biosynthesis